MATHSSIPAWRIPRAEEPGRLQPMGSQRLGHDGATKHSTAQHKPPQQWEQVLKISLFLYTHPAGSVSREETHTGM